MNKESPRTVKIRLDEPDQPKKKNISQTEQEVMRILLETRLSRGLTQAELADLTGIDQGDISKLERGSRNPSLKLLKRLAKGLDMDLEIHFVPKNKEEN